MNGLNRYNYEKILDSIKLISKSVKIINGENNPVNRELAYGLSKDLIDRLYRDVSEMKDDPEETGRTYGGHIEDGEIQEEAQ